MADIIGTSGDDVLDGTSGSDAITGLSGNDILNGGDGDDTLDGGEGNDSLTGGAGDDTILGYQGNDTAIYAGAFSDYSIASGSDAQGSWVRVTGLGAFAGDGTDTLRYVETLRFSDGIRQLGIDPNNRPLLGQPQMADQQLIDGYAFDFAIPQTAFIDLDGNETLHFRASLEDGSPLPAWLVFDPSLRRFSGIPPLEAAGTLLNVRVFASDQYPGDPGYEISDGFEIVVRAASGSDVTGTNADDTLAGTFRSETMIGLDGNDIFLGSAGADRINGGAAGPADLVDYSASSAGVYVNLQNGMGAGGDAEGDLLIQIEDIIGSAFDDHLIDTDGQGDIRGGNGNDYIVGRLGGDRLTGGAGADIFGYVSRADSVGDSSLFRVPAGDNSFQGSLGDRITDFTPGTDRLDLSLIEVLSSAVAVSGNITRLTLSTPEGEMAIEFNGVFTLNQLLDNQLQRQSGDTADNVITGTNDLDRIFALAGDDTLNGLAGDDLLSGGAGHDAIYGGDGNDVLYGGTYGASAAEVTGNDRLEGGNGGDQLYGGDGNDILDGGSGSDFLSGGLGDDIYYSDTESDVIRDDGGNDTLVVSYLPTLTMFLDGGSGIENVVLNFAGYWSVFGGSGNNRIDANDSTNILYGDAGDDIIYAYGGDDNLQGGAGSDLLDGGDGNDGLDGGSGVDRMSGGAGDDHYLVDDAGDLVFEVAGGGNDTVTSFASHYLHANVENLRLGRAPDSIQNLFGVGNDLGNDIIGDVGDNLLIGGGGDDYIRGSQGSDTIFGESGVDLLRGNEGIDYLVGGSGDDRLLGDDSADALYGEDGDDYLDGGLSFDTDILVGGLGNDTLYGISGQANPDYDLMDGGSGDDAYYVDTGADLTFEAAGGGADTVHANVTVPNAGVYLYANVENLLLEGTTAFGVGNELDNQLTGSASGNWLLGGAGNDTINGMGGNDVLFGEGGNDLFVFGQSNGADVVGDFTRGSDRIDLSAYGLSFAQLQANFVQNGNVGAIQFANGDLIVLHNVTMSQLTAADFILAPVAEAAPKIDGDIMDIQSAFGNGLGFINDTILGGDSLHRWNAVHLENAIV